MQLYYTKVVVKYCNHCTTTVVLLIVVMYIVYLPNASYPLPPAFHRPLRRRRKRVHPTWLMWRRWPPLSWVLARSSSTQHCCTWWSLTQPTAMQTRTQGVGRWWKVRVYTHWYISCVCVCAMYSSYAHAHNTQHLLLILATHAVSATAQSLTPHQLCAWSNSAMNLHHCVST